jgi:hypothetical protein
LADTKDLVRIEGVKGSNRRGVPWTEPLLLSAIAARWQLRLADGARVHPVVSSTLRASGHRDPSPVTGAFAVSHR